MSLFMRAIKSQARITEFIVAKMHYEPVQRRPGRAIAEDKKKEVLRLLAEDCSTQAQISEQTGVSISVVSRLNTNTYHDR